MIIIGKFFPGAKRLFQQLIFWIFTNVSDKEKYANITAICFSSSFFFPHKNRSVTLSVYWLNRNRRFSGLLRHTHFSSKGENLWSCQNRRIYFNLTWYSNVDSLFSKNCVGTLYVCIFSVKRLNGTFAYQRPWSWSCLDESLGSLLQVDAPFLSCLTPPKKLKESIVTFPSKTTLPPSTSNSFYFASPFSSHFTSTRRGRSRFTTKTRRILRLHTYLFFTHFTAQT